VLTPESRGGTYEGKDPRPRLYNRGADRVVCDAGVDQSRSPRSRRSAHGRPCHSLGFAGHRARQHRGVDRDEVVGLRRRKRLPVCLSGRRERAVRADVEDVTMSVVLVVEPDGAQAKLLRSMQKRLGAELILVHSTDEAMEAIDRSVPDVLLLSALLSPRDEDRLVAYLRALEGASHLQTLTSPQLSAGGRSASGGAKKGFGFKKKRQETAPVGCDPAVFAEEVAAALVRAAELRSHGPSSNSILINTSSNPSAAQPAAQAPGSSHDDPWAAAAERFRAQSTNVFETANDDTEPSVQPNASAQSDMPVVFDRIASLLNQPTPAPEPSREYQSVFDNSQDLAD